MAKPGNDEQDGKDQHHAYHPLWMGEQWRAVETADAQSTITKVLDSGDLLYEWGTALEAIYRHVTLCLL